MDCRTEDATLQITLHPAIEELIQQRQKPKNYKKGERQTVYPLKRKEDIIAMANWILQNKSKKYVLAFILGINVGLRANELLSLKMNQLFQSDGSVRLLDCIEDTSDGIEVLQSKIGRYRTVFLNAACKDALEWYFPVRGACLYCDEYVFTSREGGCIEVGTFRKVLKEAAKACGIKQNIGTHTCRKTWGWWQYKYNSIKNDMDITMLQRAYGHSSSDVTLRYLGITDEEDKMLYHGMCIHLISDSAFDGGLWRGQRGS